MWKDSRAHSIKPQLGESFIIIALDLTKPAEEDMWRAVASICLSLLGFKYSKPMPSATESKFYAVWLSSRHLSVSQRQSSLSFNRRASC